MGNTRPALVVVLLLLLLLLPGCGGGDEPGSSVPCDDAAFRAQDEELYVTQTAVSNAIAGGGDPELLLVDVRRARTALGDYLAANPPCDEALLDVAATEETAIGALDAAIAHLEQGEDAGADLRAALKALTAAQGALTGAG